MARSLYPDITINGVLWGIVWGLLIIFHRTNKNRRG